MLVDPGVYGQTGESATRASLPSPRLQRYFELEARVLAAFDQGDHEETIAAIEELLPLHRELLGNGPVALRKESIILSLLGNEYLELDQFDQARSAYGRQSSTLQLIADAAPWELDEPRLNRELVESVAALSREDRQRVRRARELHQRGSLPLVQRKIEQFDEALVNLNEAWMIRRDLLGDDHHSTALTLNNIANLHMLRGDLDKAATLLEQVLPAFRKALADEHPSIALALHNLGYTAMLQADYVAARRYLEEALAMRRGLYDAMHPDVAQTLGTLGQLHLALNDFSQAIDLLEQSRTIYRQLPESLQRPLELGVALNNLGLAYHQSGDFSAADSTYAEALEVREAEFGANHPEYAQTAANLALLLHDLKQYERAKLYYLHALSVTLSAYGVDNSDLATLASNYGCLLQDMGDYDDAELFLARALEIHIKLLGPSHPSTVMSRNNLAMARLLDGNREGAQTLYEENVRIAQQAPGRIHRRTAMAYENLGAVLAAQGRYDAALDMFLKTAAIEQRLLNRELLLMSREGGAQLADLIAGGWDMTFSLPLEALDRNPDVAETVLSRKAILLQALMSQRALAEAAKSKPGIAALQQQLATAQQHMERLVLAPSGELRQLAIDELRLTIDSLEARLNREVVEAVGPDAPWNVTLADVRRAMPGDGALVEFLRYTQQDFKNRTPRSPSDMRYVAVVVRGADSPTSVIDLGPAQAIDDSIAALYEHLHGIRGMAGQEDEQAMAEDYRDLARQLSQLVFDPLLPALTGVQRIYLGPDGALHEIPFEALVDTSGQYLIERGFEFAYVNSGRDLIRPQEPLGRGVAVFARPDYDAGVKRRTEVVKNQLGRLPSAAQTTAADIPSRPAAIARDANVRFGWRDLGRPAEDEGRDAARAFEKAGWGIVELFLRDQALEEFAKLLSGPRVLVVITHGDYADDPQPVEPGGTPSFRELADRRGGTSQAKRRLRDSANPLLRSYLTLSGANRIDDNDAADAPLDNGWLTALEISLLDLRGTQLVVLSACHTGRGLVRDGQAVAGMRSAFLRAGARTLVASLYQVPNAETSQLMRPFYEGVAAGQGKLAALNAAKLQFIRNRREAEGAAHPFYWASFILVGEP